MTLSNHVLRFRERLNITRTELADRVGITRQSLGLVEANKVVPSTLVAIRLAHELCVQVEDLFFEVVPTDTATTFVDDDIRVGDRVVLAHINGKQIARPAAGLYTYRTKALAAVAEARLDEDHVVVTKPSPHTSSESLIIAGCDLGLGLLTEHLENPTLSASVDVLWLGVNNAQALKQLANSMVHVAAVHFHETPPVQDPTVSRVHFSEWEVGWVVRRGNPCGFAGVESFVESEIRFVNRPIGAGVRTLFDDLLRASHVRESAVHQYAWTVTGHRQVAEAVATGLADVGIATASAASEFHLDFQPIRKEFCELWFPNDIFQSKHVQKLLETLNSDVFRCDLERFGPYDVTRTGTLNPAR